MKGGDEAIAAAMRAALAALPAGRSLDPTELARSLAGPDGKVWRLMMTPIRRVAVRLAQGGDATILRKGKAVDPADFKGVYRIGRQAGQADEMIPETAPSA